MSKKNPASHLKLHVEESTLSQEVSSVPFAGWSDIADFFKSTGWEAEYSHPQQQANTKESGSFTALQATNPESLGCLTLSPTEQTGKKTATAKKKSEQQTLLPKQQVTQLANGITQLVDAHQKTTFALQQREAELAACIPVIHGRDPQGINLATRLQAVLKGGAEAVGCQSTVLFMLDEATTLLKVRAAWGMPEECFTDPMRPLGSAIADLEALLGHAVVLEHQAMLQSWNVPYECQAAVCVPVSGPMVPLGTLWMFSNQPREFSDDQVNLIEIIAGRIASDLDRETLLHEAEQQKTYKKVADTTIQSWQDQLPHHPPMVEGYDIAATTTMDQTEAAGFYDWFSKEDDSLALLVGNGAAYRSPCKLTATTLRSTLRSFGQLLPQSEEVVRRSGELMWSSGVGACEGHCCYASLDPHRGYVEFTLSGDSIAVHLKNDENEPGGNLYYNQQQQPLGPTDDPFTTSREVQLEQGEVLLLLSLIDDDFTTTLDKLPKILKQWYQQHLKTAGSKSDCETYAHQFDKLLHQQADIEHRSLIVLQRR